MTQSILSSRDEVTLPLPIFEMKPVGTMRGKDGTAFSICIGLDARLVEQLKRYSLDERDRDIQEHTSDRQRFGEGSYEEWYAKDRVPFALVEERTGTLAALAWYGPKPIGRKSLRFLTKEEKAKEAEQESGDWHTIVYRSYKPFRGEGLMKQFVGATLDLYRAFFPRAILWAGISTDNPASIALAEKLGFKRVPEYVDEEKHWCAMVREA